MSTPSKTRPGDHWTAEAYSASASFVPQLTTTIQAWLSPQPSDTILDIGCGDGILTSQIQPLCHSITGYDSSPNLIAAAQRSFPHIDFQLQDCRGLEGFFLEEGERCDPSGEEEKEEKEERESGGGGGRKQQQRKYTKVFSNAALHWILRGKETRESVLRGVHAALAPGGKFVFEMGGAGNVADVHTALLSALSMRQGVHIEKARDACPWFFPSEEEMRKLLEGVGFEIDKTEVEYRPTRLTGEEGGGLEGWVRLMGVAFLDVLGDDEAKKKEVVRDVCEVLRSVIGREDGSMWLGYVRLRVAARKKGREGII